MSPRRRHLGLIILLAVYLAVTLTYNISYPLGEAPDEVAHVDLIRFLGQERHLPRDTADRQAAGYKSGWPMLYHLLVGAATTWIDYDKLPRLKLYDASVRRMLIEDGIPPFIVVHTQDEAFPYQGVVLAWHLARLASTLISAATLIVIYVTVLAILPGQYGLALGATALTAAIPQFHFIASSVADDNLLGLLCALFAWTLVKVWQNPQPQRGFALLGLWLGLALTTKYSVALLPLLVAAVLLLAVRKKQLSWRAAASRLLLFGLAMAVSAAWWLVYVEWYFNQVRNLGLLLGLAEPLLTGEPVSTEASSLVTGGAIPAPGIITPTHTTLRDWGVGLFRSFWLMAGQANLAAPRAFYVIFLGLFLLSAGGLVWAWVRRDRRLPWELIGLLVLQILLLLPFPLLRFYITRTPEEAGQGRHVLFPAATAVGLLLAWGISAWFPPRPARVAGPVVAAVLLVAVVLLVISLVSFLGFVQPVFPPRLPVQTSASAAGNVSNPVSIPFGDELALIGHQIGQVNQFGALPVTLAWRSTAYTSQDYLVELSLINDAGEVQSLWLGHPVDGRYPTRAWDPGDVVHDVVWLPLAGLEAGDYQLQLRLRPSLPQAAAGASGTALPSDAQATFELPVSLSLAPAGDLPRAAGAFAVWKKGQPASDLPLYGYRAAIPITFAKPQARVALIGPDGVERAPLAQARQQLFMFLVDGSWPSGEYRLHAPGVSESVGSAPVLRVQVRPRTFELPAISHKVGANFGDEVLLLGFDFPERKAQPGGALPITLYWQAQKPISYHLIVSNHLLNTTDLRQWGGRDRVPQDYYSTALWAPGEIVRDDYLVPIDPSAPLGVYQLDIGLYVNAAGLAWPAPLMADGQALDANSVTIGPIKVGGPPADVAASNPTPQYSRDDNLGGLVTLLGYDVNRKPDALSLNLYWRCDQAPPTDYTTFVHVRDATGQVTGQAGTIVAQMDRPPADGAYPTSLWDAGEIVRDTVQVPLPPQMSPGDYEVIVGLYDPLTGSRLPVLDSRGEPASDHIQLETVITAE